MTLDDQTASAHSTRWESVCDQYGARCHALGQRGAGSVYKPVPPETLYLDPEAWDAAAAGRRCLSFSPLPQSPGPGVIDAGGRIGRSFAPERQQENLNLFSVLKDHVEAKLEGGPVAGRGLFRGRA